MSHAMGAVRFQDGTLLYYEYNGTSDTVISKLYASEQEVRDNWRSWTHAGCHCGGDEPVEIMSTYGGGGWWRGRACRTCMAVTSGLVPFYDDVSHIQEDGWEHEGFPAWSPWTWMRER